MYLGTEIENGVIKYYQELIKEMLRSQPIKLYCPPALIARIGTFFTVIILHLHQ